MKWVRQVQGRAKVIAGCVFVFVAVVALAHLNVRAIHGSPMDAVLSHSTLSEDTEADRAALHETEVEPQPIHALTAVGSFKFVDTTHVEIFTAVTTVASGYCVVRFVCQARRLMTDVAKYITDVEMANVSHATGRGYTE